MKNFLLLIASLFIIHAVTAQEQAAVFNHYHLSPILINPAAAGFSERHQIQMNIRSQWTGFDGAPKSYLIGYNGPIGKTLGAGLSLMSENMGNMSHLRFQMNYAFRYKIKDWKVAMGFSTDFHTLKLAESVQDNPLLQDGDPIVDGAIDGNKVFDASLGFRGAYKEKTFYGLSFTNLVVTKIGDIESDDPEGALFRYMILDFGHEFDIEQYNFKLIPSVMVNRLKDKPFQADFNLRGSFINDKLIAGVTYRTGLGGITGLLLGTNIDVFKLYYSYDVSFQEVQKYNGGTHEITIAFDFDGGKRRFDRSGQAPGQ